MKDHQLLMIIAQIYLAAGLVLSNAPVIACVFVGTLFGIMAIVGHWREQ